MKPFNVKRCVALKFRWLSLRHCAELLSLYMRNAVGIVSVRQVHSCSTSYFKHPGGSGATGEKPQLGVQKNLWRIYFDFSLETFFLHFPKHEPELFWLAYSVIRNRAIKTIASVNRICGPFLIKEWRIHVQTHFCVVRLCSC